MEPNKVSVADVSTLVFAVCFTEYTVLEAASHDVNPLFWQYILSSSSNALEWLADCLIWGDIFITGNSFYIKE
jgi:hypothetical protein